MRCGLSIAAALVSSLALASAKHDPNQIAKNTLEVLRYTPDQVKIMDKICDMFPVAVRTGAWPEAEVNPQEAWGLFEVNEKLERWLDDHGKDDWADNFLASATEGRVSRSSPISCNGENDACDVPFTCDAFDSFQSALVAWSIYGLRKWTKANDEAHIDAHAFFDDNDAEMSKVMFRDGSFGKDTRDIYKALIFEAVDNFISIISIVISGGAVAAVKGVQKAFAKFLRDVVLDNINFDFGPDPVNNGKPFADSLGQSFTQIRNAIKLTTENYLRNGETSPGLISTSLEIADFLQRGSQVPLICESAQRELKEQTTDDLIRQTAATILADIYQKQGVEIFITDTPPENCPPPKLPAGFDGFILRVPTIHSDVPGAGVKCVMTSTQSGQNQFNTLQSLRFSGFDSMLLNAAVCAVNGGAGKYPPAETEDMDFGFPRCTFPWPIREGSEI